MANKNSRSGKAGGTHDIATENFAAAVRALHVHPLFAPMLSDGYVLRRSEHNLCPQDGWAVVTSIGNIHVHPTRRAEPQEWIYVLAHCLLHLGFGHFPIRSRPREWNAACDCFVATFLAQLKLGKPPLGTHGPLELPASSEERLYDIFCERGIPPQFQELGTAGLHADMIVESTTSWSYHKPDWQRRFAEGLAQAVSSAVEVAAGRIPTLGSFASDQSPAQRARSWFISSYPLLGALATTFNVFADSLLCQRMEIAVAAVNVESKEIYFNPSAGLSEAEYRFVMAHELLHVGLRHDARRQGRDPYLWNVACDYVINGWLLEMDVGHMPQRGGLYDPDLKGESAEAIYDRMVTDMRRFRKLATLRGVGLSDILEKGKPDWWSVGPGVDLDEFYRRSMRQGLLLHQEQGRGLIPAGLEEEIRALSQPPIPWDVELARWFDHHFPPPEKVHSYARPSRRQSATPDIPRPRWMPAPDWEDGRTFGVLLDTSGSMDRSLLAKALGAIASYSIARDVPAARVVFCDAATYDQGYMPPEAIAGEVRVRGRGGTVLQPGVDLLERAEDFPKEGPLLIITDGMCDTLYIRREHAFLIPVGHRLPFTPRGDVFYIK